MSLLLGIDTGGTYTDAILLKEQHGVIASAKALTTRHDLSVGIGEAVDAVLAEASIPVGDIGLVSLSTTLATNALVEGHGGRICLILIGFGAETLTRAGLEQALAGDPVIHINGGHDAHGNRTMTLDMRRLESALDEVADGVSGFAIASQFAVRNSEDEIAARDIVRAKTGRPVTCSHELSSRLGGPRRALTSVLNARLIGLIHRLIKSAESLFSARDIAAPIMIVRGDGALVSAELAKLKPIETILSGPAASLVGAAYLTGISEALVSDIGGTTTDIAVLSDGRPNLDRDGASVGGWRTMVEAVAMHTIGLGGDSEVTVVQDGLKVSLNLGPRRVMPISLLATMRGKLIHSALDQQLAESRSREFDGYFAVPVHVDEAALAGLGEGELALLDEISSGPGLAPVNQLIRVRVQISRLRRLVSRGLVTLSAVTPSDAAHILGFHDAWDDEAARKGVALLARRRDARGKCVAEDETSMAKWIIRYLQRTTAETLADLALQSDGFDDVGLARSTLAQAALDGHSGIVRVALSLSIPIVGLGAAASVYYPRIAERLNTEAVIPEHAGVANAVGAVVGRVSTTADASVTQPSEGLYRLHLSTGAEDFSNLELALDNAQSATTAEARRTAFEAGAEEVEVHNQREIKQTNAEGKEIFISARIRATASGRPRIAS